MKKIIIIMICIQIVCSCAESTKNIVGQKVLTVPETPTGKGETFFKNFELDAIVPIETTDDYLVTYIKKAVRYKDYLIFLNRPTSVFIMNIQTGKIEAFINRQGQGPGESNFIREMAVDDQHGHILIYNDYKKLLFFDMKGQFIREEKLECKGSNMMYLNGTLILNERLEGSSCYPYEFNLYDIEKKTLQTIGDSKRVDFDIKGYGKHMVKSKNIWFFAPLDYNLYRYNNGEIEIPYTLTVKKPITERLVEKSRSSNKSDIQSFFNEISENKIIYGFSSPLETDRFVMLTSNLFGFMMINKQTSEIIWEQNIEEEQFGRFIIANSFFPVDGDENRVMFIVNPIDWLRDVAAHPEKIAPKWKEQISKMNIVEDSNPILLFYKEKK